MAFFKGASSGCFKVEEGQGREKKEKGRKSGFFSIVESVIRGRKRRGRGKGGGRGTL